MTWALLGRISRIDPFDGKLLERFGSFKFSFKFSLKKFHYALHSVSSDPTDDVLIGV